MNGQLENMEIKTQKVALAQIEKLKRKIQSRALRRFSCCMISESYIISMDNLDGVFKKYLEKVDGLTKEYDLGNEIYLKFKKEAAEIIHDAAVKRNEHEWAVNFWKKYAL